jgi:hypothetical protein
MEMSQQIYQRVRPLAMAAVAMAALAGCATSTTPQLDAKFGESVTAVRDKQTLNPGAPSGDPAQGIGGKPAVHAQERYQDSFKTPPRTFEVLGIGGSLTSQ